MIIFVGTRDNKSDMLTKNVTSDTYNEHIADYIAPHALSKQQMKNCPSSCFLIPGGCQNITITTILLNHKTRTMTQPVTKQDQRY
jgi:hypothetical protein